MSEFNLSQGEINRLALEHTREKIGKVRTYLGQLQQQEQFLSGQVQGALTGQTTGGTTTATSKRGPGRPRTNGGGTSTGTIRPRKGKRTLSEATRQKMSEAQRRRQDLKRGNVTNANTGESVTNTAASIPQPESLNIPGIDTVQ